MSITFEDFERMLLEHCSPLHDTNIARDKLCELKQCGTVQDYVAASDNIVMSLPELLEADYVHTFMYGLKQYNHKIIKPNSRLLPPQRSPA